MNSQPTPFRTVERSNLGIPMDGLEFVTVKSRALGQRADVTFHIPPQARGRVDLPIVMLLHGVYGSHWAWALKGGAHVTAQRLIEEGALPPVVLVMPSDGLWGDGSGYVAHGGQDFERWIIDEVPQLATQLAAGCTSRSPLLVAGLSMGGFGALRLAGKYPHRITAAAAHSAVTDLAQLDDAIEEGRDDWSDDCADRTVLAALVHASGTLPPIRFDCGRSDGLSAANFALHQSLQDAGIPHEYAQRNGDHDWDYWTLALEDTLRFFGAVLRGDRATTEGENA